MDFQMTGELLSIILPTYNERENIIKLLESISRELKEIPYEIIVVDDNSPDGTGAETARIFHGVSPINVYIRKEQRGLATAILYGIEKSKGDKILVMDTDFNHDPKIIPRLRLLADEYDVVIGSRFVKGGGMEDRKRYYFSLLYNMLLRLLLGSKIRDNLCGYFIVSRKIIERLDLKNIFTGYGDYFIRLLYYLQRQNCTFLEIPVYYFRRLHGRSKSRFLQMLRQYTLTALKLRLGY